MAAGALCAAAVPAVAVAAAPPRAYELVTPGDDHGQDISNAMLSRDGQLVLAQSGGAIGDSPSGLGTTLLATRGESGWLPEVINVAAGGGMSPLMPTPDWARILFAAGGAIDPTDADGGTSDVYRREADGSFSLMSPQLTPGPAPAGSNWTVGFAGASADAEHVIFITPEVLDPAVAGKAANAAMLYEHFTDDLGNPVTRAVGLKDDGTLIGAGGAAGGEGYSRGFFGEINNRNVSNAISDDGSRIFFSSPDPTQAGAKPEIYLRENGETTVQVSAPAPGVVDPAGTFTKRYEGATADGSRVFFSTQQKLTADDTDSVVDLYEYDVAAHELTRLTAMPTGSVGVRGVVRASDDGSTLYFVATGTVAPNNTQHNLYMLRGGATRLIGTLAVTSNANLPADVNALVTGNAAGRPVDMTSDGRFLVFVTAGKLLPSSDPDTRLDVYSYDADGNDGAGALTLVSRSGGAAFDAALFSNAFGASGLVRRGSISDDGSRVVFQTAEALLPTDTNGAIDVYERVGGEIELISSGKSPYTSEVIGMSADGRDVLIRTRDSLVGADDDGGAYDVYDARLGGGFPEDPPAPAPCSGDACQDPPTPAPGRPTPSTSTFFGPGNLTPAPSPRTTLTVRRISTAQRAAFARTGRLTLTVSTSAAGTVVADAKARIGKKTRRVATTNATAAHPRTLQLTLRLSRTARRALQRQKRLTVRIVVRQYRATTQTASMTLRSTRAAKRPAAK